MAGRAAAVRALLTALPVLAACTAPPSVPEAPAPAAAASPMKPVLTPAPVSSRPALRSGFDGEARWHPPPANLDSTYNPIGTYMVRRR